MFCSDQAIEFWNDKSEMFLQISRSVNSFYNKRHEVIEKLLSRYSSPSTSLDVGCAGGDLVIRLSQLGFDAYGTDISASMIEAAIKKSADILLNPRVHFRLTQGQTPPFVNHFGLITAIGVLPYVMHHKEYIAYLSSMLERKGYLIVTCSNPFSFYNMMQIILHIGKIRMNREWLRTLKNLWNTGLHSGGFIDSQPNQVHSVSGLKKIVAANGYTICEMVSFYNIHALDKKPADRSVSGKVLSRLFGWTHMVIAQKII